MEDQDGAETSRPSSPIAVTFQDWVQVLAQTGTDTEGGRETLSDVPSRPSKQSTTPSPMRASSRPSLYHLPSAFPNSDSEDNRDGSEVSGRGEITEDPSQDNMAWKVESPGGSGRSDDGDREETDDEAVGTHDKSSPGNTGSVFETQFSDLRLDLSGLEAGAETSDPGPVTDFASTATSINQHYNTVFRDWLMHVLEKDDKNGTKQLQDLWAAARRTRRLRLKTFEAADYELYDSKVWHMHKHVTMNKNDQGIEGARRKRKFVTRLLTLVLGVAVGLAGCFVSYFTELILEWKLHFLAHVVEEHQGKSDIYRFGLAFAWFWGMNIVLALGAYSMVWVKPASMGSGIPETKCVLNGVNIPEVLSPSTLLCKLVGVILGVASGLPIGKEGPMIHAGAAIGGTMATLPNFKALEEFRNDRDRRDFAAMGTAAGVAAAFRTPIGGVLFAMEEGASFWSTVLTWKSFAAAVVTVVTYYIVIKGYTILINPLEGKDLFVFGQFVDQESVFVLWELSVFAVVAVAGGLLGAVFVRISSLLSQFRAKHVIGPWRRMVEMMLVSTLVSCVSFILPLVAGECRPVPTDLRGWSPVGVESTHHLINLGCPHGGYNELGSLFLNDAEVAIKLLFHFSGSGFQPSALFIFSAVYLTLECISLGLWVSSGLFIPSILAGAALGRGVGGVLGRNPQSYALVGAGAILGGIARMTISITVMMVEASGWVLFVIPMMVVFLLARSVGNRFNEGIYDTQIRVNKMPFLEQEPPEEARAQNLRVNQLMSKGVVCFCPVEGVGKLYSTLRDYDHNCFAVVDKDNRILLGTIHRPKSIPVLPWEQLESAYPNYPSLEDVKLTGKDMSSLMDLTAYVQIGPHVINEHASAHRAYIMFRTLGLRHLVVVNHYNEVVGMITRENLLSEHFESGGIYRKANKLDAMPMT